MWMALATATVAADGHPVNFGVDLDSESTEIETPSTISTSTTYYPREAEQPVQITFSVTLSNDENVDESSTPEISSNGQTKDGPKEQDQEGKYFASSPNGNDQHKATMASTMPTSIAFAMTSTEESSNESASSSSAIIKDDFVYLTDTTESSDSVWTNNYIKDRDKEEDNFESSPKGEDHQTTAQASEMLISTLVSSTMIPALITSALPTSAMTTPEYNQSEGPLNEQATSGTSLINDGIVYQPDTTDPSNSALTNNYQEDDNQAGDSSQSSLEVENQNSTTALASASTTQTVSTRSLTMMSPSTTIAIPTFTMKGPSEKDLSEESSTELFSPSTSASHEDTFFESSSTEPSNSISAVDYPENGSNEAVGNVQQTSAVSPTSDVHQRIDETFFTTGSPSEGNGVKVLGSNSVSYHLDRFKNWSKFTYIFSIVYCGGRA